jgi:transcriptional regulator with PAS, ATPase and Fis domain
MYEEVNHNSIQTARYLPSTTESSFADVQIHKPAETFEVHEEIEESLSLEDREKELIQKALEKHRGKRKYAALELGISERTLYRKIKEFNMVE